MNNRKGRLFGSVRIYNVQPFVSAGTMGSLSHFFLWTIQISEYIKCNGTITLWLPQLLVCDLSSKEHFFPLFKSYIPRKILMDRYYFILSFCCRSE